MPILHQIKCSWVHLKANRYHNKFTETYMDGFVQTLTILCFYSVVTGWLFPVQLGYFGFGNED